MEAVIHQFKLVSEGIHPPAGEFINVWNRRGVRLATILSAMEATVPIACGSAPLLSRILSSEKVLPGHILSDVVVAIASVDPILGDVDR